MDVATPEEESREDQALEEGVPSEGAVAERETCEEMPQMSFCEDEPSPPTFPPVTLGCSESLLADAPLIVEEGPTDEPVRRMRFRGRCAGGDLSTMPTNASMSVLRPRSANKPQQQLHEKPGSLACLMHDAAKPKYATAKVHDSVGKVFHTTRDDEPKLGVDPSKFDLADTSWTNVPMLLRSGIAAAHVRFSELRDEHIALKHEVDQINLNSRKTRARQVTEIDCLKRSVKEIGRAMLSSDAVKQFRAIHKEDYEMFSAERVRHCDTATPEPVATIRGSSGKTPDSRMRGIKSVVIHSSTLAKELGNGHGFGLDRSKTTACEGRTFDATECSDSEASSGLESHTEERAYKACMDKLAELADASQNWKADAMKQQAVLKELKARIAHVEGTLERTNTDLASAHARLKQDLCENSLLNFVWKAMIDYVPKWLFRIDAIHEGTTNAATDFFRRTKDSMHAQMKIEEGLEHVLERLHVMETKLDVARNVNATGAASPSAASSQKLQLPRGRTTASTVGVERTSRVMRDSIASDSGEASPRRSKRQPSPSTQVPETVVERKSSTSAELWELQQGILEKFARLESTHIKYDDFVQVQTQIQYENGHAVERLQGKISFLEGRLDTMKAELGATVTKRVSALASAQEHTKARLDEMEKTLEREREPLEVAKAQSVIDEVASRVDEQMMKWDSRWQQISKAMSVIFPKASKEAGPRSYSISDACLFSINARIDNVEEQLAIYQGTINEQDARKNGRRRESKRKSTPFVVAEDLPLLRDRAGHHSGENAAIAEQPACQSMSHRGATIRQRMARDSVSIEEVSATLHGVRDLLAANHSDPMLQDAANRGDRPVHNATTCQSDTKQQVLCGEAKPASAARRFAHAAPNCFGDPSNVVSLDMEDEDRGATPRVPSAKARGSTAPKEAKLTLPTSVVYLPEAPRTSRPTKSSNLDSTDNKAMASEPSDALHDVVANASSFPQGKRPVQCSPLTRRLMEIESALNGQGLD